MCIGFHVCNYNTKLDVFYFPCIADLLDKLGKAKYSSKIDLATAYHYVSIAKGDIHKTAFLTNKGLYECFLILFGLYNAPVTFQRLMNLSFAGFINEFVTIYLKKS